MQKPITVLIKYEKNAAKPDNPMYLSVLNIISKRNLTQLLDVAKVNNSTDKKNEKNDAKLDNPTYLSGLNIISESNLTQFQDVAKVSNSTDET